MNKSASSSPGDATIRVLHVLFDDRYGGPQKRIIKSAGAFRRLGVELELAIPDRGGNAEAAAKRENVLVHRLNIRKFPKPSDPIQLLRWLITLPWEIRSFASFFRNTDPDIVNISGAIFFAPAIAARLIGKPLVWHLNDMIFSKTVSRLLGLIVRSISTQVVAQGEAVARHYYLPAKSYELVYSHVDTAHFLPATQAELEQKAGANQTPVVGIIAHWNPLKGLEYFVDAAIRIRQSEGSNVRFVLIGSKLDTQKQYGDLIESMILKGDFSDQLSLMGFVEDPAEILRSLDILVMSSVSEACPNVVLEGMSAGISVVATDVGCVRELLKPLNGKPTGIIVPAADAEELANAVLVLLRNRRLRDDYGRAAREAAASRFTVENYVQIHEQIYKNAMR